jgi:hypothetical protein
MSVAIEVDHAQLAGLCGRYLYGGRRLDLVNPKCLNQRIRARVLDEAELQFAEA